MSLSHTFGNGQLQRKERHSTHTVLLYCQTKEQSDATTEAIRGIAHVDIIPCLDLKELSQCGQAEEPPVAVVAFSPDLNQEIKHLAALTRLIVWKDNSPNDSVITARLLSAGVKSVVHKDVKKLREVICQQLHDVHEEKQQRQKLLDLGQRNGLIGTSAIWLESLKEVQIASQYKDIPVLIYGKSGTGKELVARALHHENMQSSKGPFQAVNCATMRGDLVRAELFGHAKGSFTGAIQDRTGLLQSAEGGTMFLDEVQALDPITQAMLLRAIQEKKVTPVGSSKEVTIADVRIIASSNESLEALIEVGRFREDLYYRLNVLQVQLPLLRERPGDIEALSHHLLHQHTKRYNSEVEAIEPMVISAFQQLTWPGNVRQLENIIVSALIHKKKGDVLRFEDLPPHMLKEIAAPPAAHDVENLQGVLSGDHNESFWSLVRTYERTLITAALKRHNGNRTRAAETLDLPVRTLQRKMARLSMRVSDQDDTES